MTEPRKRQPLPEVETIAPGVAGLRFPKGFVWGSGLSAHQAEGNNVHSDWWQFEQSVVPEGGDVSGAAADHWNRYAEDFAIARDLFQCAVRISIEWARIEPQPGVIDNEAVKHYQDVINTICGLGLEPWIVLHHFSTPWWLSRYGGWEGHEAPRLFGRYAELIADRIGPCVKYWIPINEPLLLAVQGYGAGNWPPGIKGGLSKAHHVAERLAEAHHRARAAIRQTRPDACVGIAVNSVAITDDPHSRGDKALHKFSDYIANWWFVDRTLGDSDFIGLQYYSRIVPREIMSIGQIATPDAGEAASDMGWPIYPRGIYDEVMEAWRRYGLPIYITENGIADADDSQRRDFITDHLAWLHRALREAADVRGYFHWSLIDNYEWLRGFGPRFGLAEVDYETFERTVRPSARLYGEIARTGLLAIAPDHPSIIER